MKFEALRQRMKARMIFRAEDLRPSGKTEPHEGVQLSRWVKEGKLHRLKKGVYMLAPVYRETEAPALAVSEALYRPSYLSLEWALSHYGLIPDTVGSFTSVTTLKTARFNNFLGAFIYRHVQPRYFFGYLLHEKPERYSMATPEKALMDFIYLSLPAKTPLTADALLENYRLQNLDTLKKPRLGEYLGRFDDPRVQKGTREVMRLLRR